MVQELFVLCALVMVIVSMLFPLPTEVLDFLLVGNLVGALILLTSALYVSDSLKLSSLPTLLLLATLYRLALNVASTRLILGQGEGGRVIEAFGKVVIGGNVIVGVVVFLVITIIQFIVIAKGSERVAEVAARFTLDALPGKQMSIDADVRSGSIDFETARKRRSEMQMESRFYGALDGAMKFVKGDAIAGFIIIGVNLIGGMVTGLMMEGLNFHNALSKYSILTVGDGLISQIPALLNALAAGMVVTRVSRDDGTNLIQEVIQQLSQVKKAKILIGILTFFLAWTPGMPSFPFLCLSGILFGGLLFRFENPKESSTLQLQPFEPRTPALLKVEIGDTLAKKIPIENISNMFQEFRRAIYETLGLILIIPESDFSVYQGDRYRILMRGIPVCNKEFLDSDTGILDSLRMDLISLVENRSYEFIDDILTRRTLDFFDKEAPELISYLVPQVVTVTQLSEVLKGLLKEGVSIRHFDIILQAIAEAGPKRTSERMLLEEVRVALRRVICQGLIISGRGVKAHVLSPILDIAMVQVERENKPLQGNVVATVVEYIQETPTEERMILCSKGARRLLKECLELRSINIPVLAHEEIVEEIRLEICGEIRIVGEEGETQILDRLVA